MDHVLQTNVDMSPKDYYRLARQHYNAFKHKTGRDGAERDDVALREGFDDQHNDAVLFIGWSDLLAATGSSPKEAQVFQAWFYASYPEKLASTEHAARFLSAFLGLLELSRRDQKRFLKAQIEQTRTNEIVMNDTRTDPRPLV